MDNAALANRDEEEGIIDNGQVNNETEQANAENVPNAPVTVAPSPEELAKLQAKKSQRRAEGFSIADSILGFLGSAAGVTGEMGKNRGNSKMGVWGNIIKGGIGAIRSGISLGRSIHGWYSAHKKAKQNGGPGLTSAQKASHMGGIISSLGGLLGGIGGTAAAAYGLVNVPNVSDSADEATKQAAQAAKERKDYMTKTFTEVARWGELVGASGGMTKTIAAVSGNHSSTKKTDSGVTQASGNNNQGGSPGGGPGGGSSSAAVAQKNGNDNGGTQANSTQRPPGGGGSSSSSSSTTTVGTQATDTATTGTRTTGSTTTGTRTTDTKTRRKKTEDTSEDQEFMLRIIQSMFSDGIGTGGGSNETAFGTDASKDSQTKTTEGERPDSTDSSSTETEQTTEALETALGNIQENGHQVPDNNNDQEEDAQRLDGVQDDDERGVAEQQEEARQGARGDAILAEEQQAHGDIGPGQIALADGILDDEQNNETQNQEKQAETA